MIELDGNERLYGFWTFLSTDLVTECSECGRIINRREYYFYERLEKENLICERSVCKDCATDKGVI